MRGLAAPLDANAYEPGSWHDARLAHLKTDPGCGEARQEKVGEPFCQWLEQMKVVLCQNTRIALMTAE
jgi:hypothetical protein